MLSARALQPTRPSRVRCRQRSPVTPWLAALLAGAGCVGEGASDAAAPTTRLVVRTAERADARALGADTLTDSARLLRLFPEADGDAVVFTFADPVRRVTSGLGITQRRVPAPALLWPDSVTQVWWSGPHALAFNTGGGAAVHAVVDIHAERATVADGPAGPPPATAPAADSAARRRASTYVDSLRGQPGGRPERSALVYGVRGMRVAPGGGGLAAFYVTAVDSGRPQVTATDGGQRQIPASDGGRQGQVNPGWYAIDMRSGAVTPIDEVVGPAAEMPESAAGWTADGRFVYAKRLAIWEADVRRAARGGTPAADTPRGTVRSDTVADSTMPDSLAGP